ncbi:MAG: hypothetical protein WCJ35_26895 [Planctomycetota bacterium]
MRVSSIAATAANNNSTNGNGHPHKSPALDQLRAAIEPDALAGGNQAASDAATAVMEAGEDNDGDEESGDHDDAGEDVEFVRIGQPDIATGTMDAAQVAPVIAHESPGTINNPACVAPVIDKTAVSSAPASAPYDPIADVEEEISEIGERIVAHSCKISELDAALKAEKKSWKTGADELVALHVRKANLLLSKNEREKEKAAREATTVVRTFIPVLDPSRPQTDLTNLSYREEKTESTEAHAARIAEAFAPAPESSANLPPTPAQERYDHDFRSLAMDGLDGLTPKILEILHANDIYTVGAWQDLPKRGLEYTQLSAGGAKLTEARFEKVMDAMMAYMKANPRPVAEVVEVAVSEEPAASVVDSLDVDDI